MSNGKILYLSQQVLDTYDDSEQKFFSLTEKEAVMLLSQIDYFKWRTRWTDTTYTQDELDAIAGKIADELMNPLQLIEDCADVENCLEASPTITIINNEITTVTNDITEITNNVTNVTNDVAQVQESLQDIEQTTPKNTYAPPPDKVTQPDAYCGTAWYIANQLNDYIQSVITDAQTITLLEFLAGILPNGGYEQNLLVQLWNLIIANANPNLATECANAVQYVAEAFYCADLVPQDAITRINADINITSDAKQAYSASIHSWMDNKFAIATAIGQNDLTQDCTGFNCSDQWEYTIDFTSGNGGTRINPVYSVWVNGNGYSPVLQWNMAINAIAVMFPQTTYVEDTTITYVISQSFTPHWNFESAETPPGNSIASYWDLPTTAGTHNITRVWNASFDHHVIGLGKSGAYVANVILITGYRVKGSGTDPQLHTYNWGWTKTL